MFGYRVCTVIIWFAFDGIPSCSPKAVQVGQPEKFPKIVHELFFAPNAQCSI